MDIAKEGLTGNCRRLKLKFKSFGMIGILGMRTSSPLASPQRIEASITCGKSRMAQTGTDWPDWRRLPNRLRPQPQRHMWSTMVTLNPMVLVDTKLMVDIMFKSDYRFIKYLGPNLVPTDTMEFRVTMVDNMCLCS